MNRFISDFSQSMQNVRQITRNHPFTKQHINPFNSCIFMGQWNLIISKYQIHNRFSDHSQLHQTGIGITVQVFFRQFSKISKNRKLIVQKCKI